MLDIALHTGGEHPDLWWVLVPSLVSFLAGIGIGTFSERVRGWLRPGHEPSND
ncbi:hypothetical protein SAMN05444422_101407 [Halobiforma haloterrestris]|uniref:Uncharacterized protein n=2 Tax=Natronobacterium TaxID=2256 RepID=M0LIJ8_NATLA|nr:MULTISPECIES: hypothetical protein [Halobiforma]EMA31825.1 hypothetical protein C445_13460 [Halobiforma lacisalsi AJ5]SFB71353.1 hypothetical protein SAMN05444422_101407 [Halobiforma haloterrestris]